MSDWREPFTPHGIRSWFVLATLAVCLVLGGQGPHAPIASGLCLLCALLLVSYELLVPGRLIGREQRWAFPILLGAAALPLLQLVPLPPRIWTSLPGRNLIVETLKVADLPVQHYYPLTFDPLATAGAALHTLPALAMFISVGRLKNSEKLLLLRLIICVALASLLTPIVPIGRLINAAVGAPLLTGSGYAGFFVNRNHQADFLWIAFVCLACLQAHQSSRHLGHHLIAALVGCILLLGALRTGSRAALALLPLVIIAGLAMFWRAHRAEDIARRRQLLLIGAVLVLLLAWSASFNLVPRIVERISLQGDEDMRFQAWPNIVWAIGQYFPAGTGIGTFDLVYRAAEPLDGLSFLYMNQAHNEYLQVVLEGGLAGAVLLVLGLAWYGAASLTAWRWGGPLQQAGSIVLGVYVLHSMVDFPLRTISHAAMLGLFAAVLANDSKVKLAKKSVSPLPTDTS